MDRPELAEVEVDAVDDVVDLELVDRYTAAAAATTNITTMITTKAVLAIALSEDLISVRIGDSPSHLNVYTEIVG